MSVDLEPSVRHAPPPPTVARVLNPLMRSVLRTPMSRVIRPLAILDFAGRRTGQRRRVVVGWHVVDGISVVVTPAAWRVNFADGWPARVRTRGRNGDYLGTLEPDPAVVADAINTLLRSGTSPGLLALRMPSDHVMTVADVIATQRAIIRFEPAAGSSDVD